MRGVIDIMTVREEAVMGGPLVLLFIPNDQVQTMVGLAALCMIGTMDHHMTSAGALIMVGTEVLNMVDIAGIVYILIY